MKREERIAWARRQAAAKAPELARERERKAAEQFRRLSSRTEQQLRTELHSIETSGDAEAMGPEKSPSEWRTAREAIRDAVIEAARRHATITYAAVRMIAYETTGMWLGWSLTGRMCGEINRATDECMLSSIIVGSETDRPGGGFEPYARDRGFEGPIETLQREVFERFERRDADPADEVN